MGKSRVPKAALEVAQNAARQVRALEAAALAALHGSNDVAAHRAKMSEKCVVLTSLPEEVEAYLPETPTPETEAFLAGLEDFARRAGMALSLESIFFMSALLYPDDYQDGDPNDLERFLERFEAD